MQKEIVMRHIVINGCIEGVCPFFVRKKHYDYNDECRCNHPSLDKYHDETLLHESDDYETDYDENRKPVTITIPQDCDEVGLFPKFCPLDKIQE